MSIVNILSVARCSDAILLEVTSARVLTRHRLEVLYDARYVGHRYFASAPSYACVCRHSHTTRLIKHRYKGSRDLLAEQLL